MITRHVHGVRKAVKWNSPFYGSGEHGWFLSFAGNVTFKNAQDLRDAAAVAPRDLLLVETDAPFLTPVPHRGRPNASYLVPHTMRLLAELRGNDLGRLCAAVEGNTFAAYGGSWD